MEFSWAMYAAAATQVIRRLMAIGVPPADVMDFGRDIASGNVVVVHQSAGGLRYGAFAPGMKLDEALRELECHS